MGDKQNMRNITAKVLLLTLAALALGSCRKGQQGDFPANKTAGENLEGKRLLQGIWVDEETEEVSFRAEGDTIYYPDSLSQPAYFRLVGDSLELNDHRYAVVKQSAHVFWFRNQSGDVVKLYKNDDPQTIMAFSTKRPQVITYNTVVNRDSVILFNGERYHWYITINPTRYKVVASAYNDDGVSVDNIYYDNIIHLSLFQGARRLFSSDFRKQMFQAMVPKDFLSQAILCNLEYATSDDKGFHFYATVCKPDGASCYMVEILLTREGRQQLKLIEY